MCNLLLYKIILFFNYSLQQAEERKVEVELNERAYNITNEKQRNESFSNKNNEHSMLPEEPDDIQTNFPDKDNGLINEEGMEKNENNIEKLDGESLDEDLSKKKQEKSVDLKKKLNDSDNENVESNIQNIIGDGPPMGEKY